MIINTLQNVITDTVLVLPETSETVLINSNFRCGYFIDREKMYNILKYKYNINTTYDACSYPGIQCKYLLENNLTISFMIFRTGSVLIVGKCNEKILNVIYTFLKKIFHEEYHNIYHETPIEMEKQNKIKRKKYTTITVSK